MSEQRERLTYIGRAINTKNKLSYMYENQLGKQLLFSKKLKGIENIGTTIEVTNEGDGVYHGPYDIIGNCNNKEKLSKWQNDDRMMSTKHRLQNDILKESKDHYEESLKPLKEIYRNLHPTMREIFIIKLILDLKK